MNSQVKGTIAGILSASTYGCSPALALLLYATSFDAANALFYRYLGALVLCGRQTPKKKLKNLRCVCSTTL